MKQYLELCNKILNEGTYKKDRTNTGTYYKYFYFKFNIFLDIYIF